MEEFSAYSYSSGANTTSYGDDYFTGNLPTGAVVEVTQQPKLGTLDLSTVPSGWQYSANQNAEGSDEWKWRPVVNGVPGGELTVIMNVALMA